MAKTICTALALSLCILISPGRQVVAASSGSAVSEGEADRLLIVHCLLPGQVRQLGSRTTYVSPRRAAKITAAECEVRGGEYVREDQADLTSALSVWLPAAREGDVDAQINVGTIFERGLGRVPDFVEAAAWYRKAAESGSVRAQLKLSELYESGRGVPLDLEEAVRWYRLAMGESDSSAVVVDALAMRNAEISTEMTAIVAELGKIQAENRRLQAAVAASRHQSEQLSGENSVVTGEVDELAILLDARQQDIDRLTDQLQAARSAAVASADAAVVVSSEYLKAESRLEKTETQLAVSQTALSDTSEALDSAQSEIQLQRAEIDDRELTIGALEVSIAEIKQDLTAEKSSVIDLSARVENLQTNTRGTEALEVQAAEQAVFAPPLLTLIDPKLATTRGLVKVSAPAPGSMSRVVGRVSAPAGLLSLTVDGAPVEPNSAGMFLSDLENAAGRSVNIVAIDQTGQAAEVSFDYQSKAPARPTVARVATSWEGLPFGRFKALVIGNNRYGSLPMLQTAEADAAAVAQLLGTRYGFEVTLLRNATRFQVLSALNELRETLTSEDNLIIYYAGHGELDRVNMRGYWLPVDADRTNTANWISNISITDILNSMSARHVLLLADSCYSGALTRSALTSLAAGRTAEEELNWVRTMLGKRSRQALTSGGLQPVLDSGGGSHSIFAKALITVLESNDALLEGRDLFEAVAARVAYQSSNLQFEQVPEFAPIRHAGHEAGAFFLRPL